MINLKVVNWRCIEDLKLKLARLNIFVGPNSTGKSSLAYAIYLASKSRTSDPQILLTQLYGYGFDKIARFYDNKPQFPISIKIKDSEFSVKPQLSQNKEKIETFEITRLAISPWVDEFLLPSRRVAYVQILMLLPKIIEMLRTKPEVEAATRTLGGWVGGFFELFKALPILPPFSVFASDYTRALTGIRTELLKGESRESGSYIMSISPLFSLINFVVQDQYIKLQLPPELAPDGLLDFTIFDSMIQKVPENSLVVIEEPEIHKNPRMVVEFTEHIVKTVLNKKLTLIMTTHSDIPLITIAKLVAEKMLKVNDIKTYYFKRDPWTKLSEIKFYEDGTIENLPDTEELIARLF